MIRVIVDLTRMKERHAAVVRHTVDADGIEIAAYAALFELVSGGPMRSSELADRTHADPSTTSRHVSTLVDLGFAERSPDPRDRRASLVSATQAGVDKTDDIRRWRNERLTPLIADWTDEDLDRFAELGSRVLRIFEDSLVEHTDRRARCAESAPAAAPQKSKGSAR